jgi:endonuclease YncB( thermonuclease family)
LALVSLVTSSAWPGPRTYGTLTDVQFLYCYDGDTCTFNIPYVHPLLGKKIAVRFRGIDTPEIKGKCEKEKAIAQEAKKLVNQMLKQATAK